MPRILDIDEYRAVYQRDDVWRPPIEEIAGRHGLRTGDLERAPDGTHIVYFAGGARVIKMFCPLFAGDSKAERVVARFIPGKIRLSTPEILAEGELDGWPYLVMTRVQGRRLRDVWAAMDRETRTAIVRDTGRLIGELRGLRVEGLEGLRADWPAFVAAQVEACVERHRRDGVSESLLAGIAGYVARAPELYSGGFRSALLLSDITDEHIMVTEVDGRQKATGYIDFGDAMIGDPAYEIVAPGLDFIGFGAELLHALLAGAGYAESEFNSGLRRRLMTYTLIHPYMRLPDLLDRLPSERSFDNVEELAAFLWPV